MSERQLIRFGPFDFDLQCGELRENGTRLKLQGQPIHILEILLEKPGQLVTRDQLRDRLWTPDTFVDFEHSLNTAIKKLRQALGDEADTPRYIETLQKRGYRFIGKLRIDQTVDNTERQQTAEALQGKLELPNHPKRFVGRRSIAIVSASCVVAIGALLYFVTKPAAMPRIVASHALTKTRYQKVAIYTRLRTDGNAIYFREKRPDGAVTLQLSLTGGEPSVIPVAGGDLRDISRDGSELLFMAPDPKGERDDAWIQTLRSGPPRLILKNARWPMWTADGRSIIFARNDKEFYRANTDGSNVQLLATVPDVTGLTLSPDGEHMRFGVSVVTGGGSLWEAGSDGSNPHPILEDHKENVLLGDWSPDGQHFFFLSSDGERFNLWATSEQRHWWKRNPPAPRQLTFGPLSMLSPLASRDGKHLYAIGKEPHGELVVYDQRKGGFVPYLGGIAACFTDFSRDGEWVAYVSYPEGTLWRSRLDSSQRQQLTVPPLRVLNPRWSPDGKLIVFTDVSDTVRRGGSFGSRIYAVSAEGGGPMLLVSENGGPVDPTWSPDGGAIVYAGRGELHILDLHTQQTTTVAGSKGYWSPRWSPDGKYLIGFKGSPPTAAFFSFATQQWTSLGSEFFSWPNWSSDGKSVYAMSDRGSLVRVGIPDGKTEHIAVPLQGLPITGLYFSAWFGVTPDGRLITTRDTGVEEIYDFELEYE